jgi:hypothetical protein
LLSGSSSRATPNPVRFCSSPASFSCLVADCLFFSNFSQIPATSKLSN